MRMELRVCQHCYDGEHGNDHKTAVTKDLVKCANGIKEHKEVLDLDEVHITWVREDDAGQPKALPVVAATLEDDEIAPTDTQLVTEDDNGLMLLYQRPPDMLKVLYRNLDGIDKEVDEDVLVNLSLQSAEAISQG